MSKVIRFEGKDGSNREIRIVVVIHRATILDSIRRNELLGQGLKAKEKDPDRRIAHVAIWPVLLGAAEVQTFAVSGKKARFTFEDFISLPDIFVQKWMTSVYEENPHWSPGFRDDQETVEKKRSKPTASSSPSMEIRKP